MMIDTLYPLFEVIQQYHQIFKYKTTCVPELIYTLFGRLRTFLVLM